MIWIYVPEKNCPNNSAKISAGLKEPPSSSEESSVVSFLYAWEISYELWINNLWMNEECVLNKNVKKKTTINKNKRINILKLLTKQL